jgi:hypothetical protein
MGSELLWLNVPWPYICLFICLNHHFGFLKLNVKLDGHPSCTTLLAVGSEMEVANTEETPKSDNMGIPAVEIKTLSWKD